MIILTKKIIAFAILSTSFLTAFAQADENTSLKWVQVQSPVNSNIKYVSFFPSGDGMAYGKQLIYYQDGEWSKNNVQPPTPIALAFQLDSNSFFISSDTRYQESDFYFGSYQKWEKIWIPLANTISAFYFIDKQNGVVAGLGEIARLKNNRWQWLPPPSNHSISTLIMKSDSIVMAVVQQSGLYQFDSHWTKIKGGEKVRWINSVNGVIYLLGDDYLGFINPQGSVVVLSADEKLKNITSFYIIDKNNIMAAGLNGLILQFKNGRWTKLKSGVSENLNAVWMMDRQNGWIVGDNGVILHYTSEPGTPYEPDNWKGFEKITLKAKAKVIDDEYGVVAADFNNDGQIDIFTCGLFESNHLYLNTGNNTFLDKAQQWKVSGDENNKSNELNLGACAADFDNDGDDDLYVGVLNGSNKLYKNINGKRFVDYSEISRCASDKNDRTNAIIAGDVDNDGDLDIFITNENTTNRLFLNNGAGIFSEATKPSDLITDYGGMGCSFGDIDNDGDLDLYVANWSKKNTLYKNMLKETGQLFFKDITESAHVSGKLYSKSNAVVFSDINNDASPDLFVTNRKTSNKLYINNGHGVFSDVTGELIGTDSSNSYGAVVADFDGDGFKDIYVSNVGENVFYKNIAGKHFVNSTLKYDAGMEGYSTGSAVFDFNNNGNADLYLANYLGESSAILQNNYNNHHLIRVKISGLKDNHNGIGTKIYVYKQDGLNQPSKLIYFTEISGGSGYASMNQRFLPIPIPGQEFAEVKIVFPSGLIKSVNHIKAGESIVVQDVSGLNKFILLAKRRLVLLVKDPHNLLQFFSWLAALIFILLSMVRGAKRYRWTPIFIVGFSLFLIFLFYVQSGYFEFKPLLFSVVLPVLSVVISAVLVHFYFERKNIKLIALIAQERIRENLSRDLHDDLASTISTISIYLTLLRYNLKGNEKKLTGLLDKTVSLAGDASSAITDMIWAIKPQPESLGNLIIRISNNFSTLFREKGIRFNTESGFNLDTVTLDIRTKKNIYLIIKEALNNILKYSKASQVEITIAFQNPEIHLTIKDDGTGFDLAEAKNKGHGLNNMKIRADEMESRFEINSSKDNGTEIDLVFKA